MLAFKGDQTNRLKRMASSKVCKSLRRSLCRKKILDDKFSAHSKKFVRHFYFWPFIRNDSLKLRSFIARLKPIRSGWKQVLKILVMGFAI